MDEFAIRARATLWWTLPLLIAVAFIAWETDFGRTIRRLPPADPPVEARPVVTSLLPEYQISGGTAARAETVQRTLFNPTRRPAPVLATDPTKSRMQKGQFALTGTMVVGGKNTAFLRENAGGKPRRVIQGETINGLLVAEVKTDRVRLALGDESEELVLRVTPNPRPTVQPAFPASVPAAAPAAAPVPAPVPTAAVQQPAVPSAADASLAERRRAARAAQAAIQQQTSTPDGNPVPAPNIPTTPAQAPAAQPTGSAQAAPAPDPRWAEMYRQYQQPRTVNPPK
jgi:hypothetical protein